MRLATGRLHSHHVGLQHQEAEITREQTQELGNTSLSTFSGKMPIALL